MIKARLEKKRIPEGINISFHNLHAILKTSWCVWKASTGLLNFA